MSFSLELIRWGFSNIWFNPFSAGQHIQLTLERNFQTRFIRPSEPCDPQLSVADIDNRVLDKVTRRIYESAAEDSSLGSFLFTENLAGLSRAEQDAQVFPIPQIIKGAGGFAGFSDVYFNQSKIN